jgi:adenylate cyclase class IV
LLLLKAAAELFTASNHSTNQRCCKEKKAMDQNLEIEVKFFVADEKMVRNKIITLGGVSKGRNFETNIRYEDKMHTLWSNRSILRLRKDNQVRLTVKQNLTQQSSDFKSYEN